MKRQCPVHKVDLVDDYTQGLVYCPICEGKKENPPAEPPKPDNKLKSKSTNNNDAR